MARWARGRSGATSRAAPQSRPSFHRTTSGPLNGMYCTNWPMTDRLCSATCCGCSRSNARRWSCARLLIVDCPDRFEEREAVNNQETPMLKFYFNGSPNPTKTALFLEEAGPAYAAPPPDTIFGLLTKP